MNIRIFQSITNLKLRGIEFYPTPNFTLTSNQELKKDNFSHPLFEKAIGSMRYEKLHTPSDYAFLMQETEGRFDETTLTSILGHQMDRVHQFANGLATALWFIKDNSVNMSDIFGHITQGAYHSMLCMSPISNVSNCHGENQEVSFTRNEIDQAIAVARQYIKICPQDEEEFKDRIQTETFSNDINKGILKGENDTISYNKFNRIERAIKFMQVVRETGYLPRKIALYMPIFECLFATEASEVTHKVAERVAFYIGNEGKKDIFKVMKAAYNVRSRYLHGEELLNSQKGREYQTRLSSEIDDIARYLLTRIIMEDSSNFLLKKPLFEDFLSDIIFQ